MAKPEPLMTPGDVAKRLNKPEKTLAQWRYKRVGPPYLKLVGGEIRYEPDAVEEWLRRQVVPA